MKDKDIKLPPQLKSWIEFWDAIKNFEHDNIIVDIPSPLVWPTYRPNEMRYWKSDIAEMAANEYLVASKPFTKDELHQLMEITSDSFHNPVIDLEKTTALQKKIYGLFKAAK